MHAAEFESSAFGSPRRDPGDRFVWFEPATLPRDLQLDNQTLLALSRADEALGRLAGVGRMLRNPRLLMRPYATKEALASARIEGTQADLREVFEAEARPSAHVRYPEVLTVSRYLRALEEGLELVAASGVLTFDVVLSVHRTLLGPDLPGAGKLRDVAVWLGSPTDRPESAVFVPPIGRSMSVALEDWIDYLSSPPDLPPLIRAALLHYYFLTVHPFVDGNGRVGRLLVLLFLATEGRLPVPLLYLSSFFENRRRDYYDRLQAVRTRGEIQAWIQFFLTAVEAQANDGVDRAKRLLDLREQYRAELAGSRNRSSEVVELLFENPVITTALVRDTLQVTNQGALNLIRSLQARDWLVPIGTMGRGGARLWLATDVYGSIEEDYVVVPA